MDQITHEMRMEHWKQIITQCQSRPEGQSAKQWMRENGIVINLITTGREGFVRRHMQKSNLPAPWSQSLLVRQTVKYPLLRLHLRFSPNLTEKVLKSLMQ